MEDGGWRMEDGGWKSQIANHKSKINDPFGIVAYGNADHIIRKKGLNKFGPFDKTIGSRIEVILIPDIVCFLKFVYPVKIEMEQGF
jgi:hypothetical protein